MLAHTHEQFAPLVKTTNPSTSCKNPRACHHLEMETYTWEVLPEKLRSVDVVEQVTKEYQWTLQALQERGLGQ